MFYYFSVYILCLPRISQTFDNVLLEKIFISLTYFKTYIIFSLFPFIVLLPDIIYNYVRKIYFPTVLDQIVINEKKYLEEAEKIQEERIKIGDEKSNLNDYVISPFIDDNHIVKEIRSTDKIVNGKTTEIKESDNDNPNQRIKTPSSKISNRKTKNLSENVGKEATERAQAKISLSSLNENMDFGMDEGNVFNIY